MENMNRINTELNNPIVYKDPDGNVVAKGNYKNDQKLIKVSFRPRRQINVRPPTEVRAIVRASVPALLSASVP